MRLEITKPISRKEWLMYLHAGGNADEELQRQLSEAEKLLCRVSVPRAVYRIMDTAHIPLEGFSVRKHLEGCSRTAVMAVTLGAGVDNLIKKTQIKDVAMAVILDSGASVLADQMCDDCERIIRMEASKSGLYTTPRFSPGYGDYPIEFQSDIIRLVNAQRRIGLNVTADSLMIPRKSVTAVIGMADHPVKGRLATCDECVLREKCILRKEGRFCGKQI